MKLTVMMPAYNEERYIKKAIDSLLSQSYEDFELIVVDDGSTDSTRDIVNSYSDKRVRLIVQDHGGPARARNLAVDNSSGEILVSIDADMMFDKDYLKILTALIIEGKEEGTFHLRELVANTDKVWARCWGVTRTSPERNTSRKRGIFRAIKLETFKKLGGFDPAKGYFDDTPYKGRDIGPELLGVENAICYHHNPESLKEVFLQTKWIGGSLVLYPKLIHIFIKKFWYLWSTASLILGVWIGTLFFINTWYLLPLVLVCTVLIGMLGLTTYRTVKEGYISHLWALPVFYTVRMTALVCGASMQLFYVGVNKIKGRPVSYKY